MSDSLYDGIGPWAETLVTVDAAELLARPYEAPRFLIEHLVPENSIVLLSADTGSGKTSLLLHTALAASLALPVAGRFGVCAAASPVLYFNGEMTPAMLTTFLRANALGMGIGDNIPAERLKFQGKSGRADLFLSVDNDNARWLFRNWLLTLRPKLVILDTLRALFEVDESKTTEVRKLFSWLREVSEEFSCTIIVAHHVRKLSAVSNALRERVSGARDLIAAVDVHIALRAPAGRPANAILLDKTRTPHAGVHPGTEWPLQGTWTGEPPRSLWIAAEPSTQSSAPIESAQQEILDLLTTEGPKTKKDLAATGGTRRRALEALLKDGQVSKAGKKGQADLYDLQSPASAELFDDES
jgi:AAA domain